jgi:DNA-binding PadR family transcriptional regulator
MSAIESSHKGSSGVGIRLTPTSYLVLGMVRLGFTSGYAIKKTAELSTQAYWSISLAQVYPELGRLLRAGLLTRRSEPRGARARSAYAVTDSGEISFFSWLRSSKLEPFQIHDEGLLRLFFADCLPRGDRLDLLRRMRDKDLDKGAHLRSRVPIGAATNPPVVLYPAAVSALTADTSDFSAGWLDRRATQFEHDSGKRRNPSRFVESTPSRSSAPIKLTTFSFLILGMVRGGFNSGYAIKKIADISTQVFWPTSFAQLYRELARLERAGLLSNRKESGNPRARSEFSITSQGIVTLRTWLRSTLISPPRPRHEGLLRLFFADALAVPDQLELIRRIRTYFRDQSSYMQDEILPHADAAEALGTRFPYIVARLGSARFAYMADWLTRFEAQLQAGRPQA